MQIAEKLTISSRTDYISFIDEGLFLRIYNQSAYIINELYNQKLTLSCNIIHKLDDRRIIYCAFPKSSITYRFKHAQKTKWGYELQGDFDLTHYENWFNIAYKQAEKRLNNQSQTTTPSESSQSTQTEQVCLNSQHIAFLKSWQRGIYPNEVTDGFVESLKQQLT